MTVCYIDFESRSRCDLKAHGGYNNLLEGK